jgi:hypothetical protein
MMRLINDDGYYVGAPGPPTDVNKALEEAQKIAINFVKKWIRKGYCRRDVQDVLKNAVDCVNVFVDEKGNS